MQTERIRISELFYYLFFGLMLFAKGVGLYDGQPVFKILLVLALAAWAGKMVTTLYTPREAVWIFLLLVLGVSIYLISGEKGALLYILMVTGLKNMPMERVFKAGLVCWGLSYIVMTVLYAAPMFDGPFKIHEKYGMGMVIRWGLGYSHPNVLHISYFTLTVFIIMAFKAHYTWKTAAALMLGNLLVFFYSLSSTGVIIVTAYLMLNLYWVYRKKFNRAETALIQLVLPVFLVYSLLAPVLTDGKVFEILDKLTNTRLRLAKHFLTTQPVTLFGTRLSAIITDKLTMDNSYVFAFVTYGAVLFVLIMVGYFILINRLCKDQKGAELSVILSSLFAGLTEPFLFNTSFKNMSLLFFKDLLFEKKEGTLGIRRLAQHEILIPGIRVDVIRLKECWIRCKKAVLITAFVGVVCGAVFYQAAAEKPAYIAAARKECDIKGEKESIYLESEEAAESTNGRAVGYADAATEMVIYDGNIVALEHCRDLLFCSLFVGCAAGMIVFLFCSCRQSMLKKNRRKGK